MRSIGAFFVAIGRGIDVVRKFLHLVLLLIIFGFILGAWRVSVPYVPSKAALVVAPEGDIVDQLSGDPIERAIAEAQGADRSETLLWDLVDAIRAAAKDDRIELLVLDLEYMTGAGQATLEEVARALREFRASKKRIIAYGTTFLQEQYYLAAFADQVYLDPQGQVIIDGYEAYRWFPKELFEKVGVDWNVFRVGAYKSAVEVYTRSDMSPEAREESLDYMGSLWRTYQKATTGARKLSPEAISTYVATMPDAVAAARGNSAQVALKAGLITGIKSRQQVENEVIKLVGEDENTGSFNAVDHTQYARVAHAAKALTADGTPRVAVVVASGEILDGDQPPGTIGGDSTARLIRQARIDEDIRAVVMRVDSPGGSVLASENIHREIAALKAAGKPVVVSMGDLAASGGYYIAAPADEIWASPATITGSIGIFAVIPTINRTLDKVGVKVDGVGTTPLSGSLRVDKPLSDAAKKFLQSTIEFGYEEFLARVSAGRKKTREQIDAVAQGRVWSGEDAQRHGLVDKLGSFDDAVKAAAKRAKLDEYEVDFMRPEMSWAQELALSVKVSALETFARMDGSTQRLMRVAKQLDPLTREVERLSRFDVPNRLYAYCFCNVR
jgi:protease IV